MSSMAAAAPPGSDAEKLGRAKEAENGIAKDARKAGVPVFQFDPDMTPEEKKAQAKKAIPAELDLSKAKPKPNAAGAAVVSDVDDGSPSIDFLTPRTNGTNGTTNGALKSPVAPATANGKKPTWPKAGDGDWSRTGWEPRFGSLNDALGIQNETAGEHQTLLESQLDDKFFGDWYHNAGIIVFSCLATWFITKIGGGLAWVLIIMSACATYYRTSIRRVRRNVRDDLGREMAKSRMESDHETLEWLNTFVLKFWPIYQPVLAATIVNTVDGILAGATPGFLDSIKMTTFTLGTKPPRIDHVKTYPKTEDDIVEMDWSFSFTPNDTDDLTSRQLKNRINPKIVLEVRLGKGIASTGVPIILEDMAFSGTMKVKIKLQLPFPHIEKVDVCFLGRPTFDYVLKPMGGDTFGIDIGFMPGLSTFIQEQIHGNLGPMLYAPNVFTVEVAKMLGGAPIDSAIGVLAVTIHRAHGLKNPDKFSGTPDPYTVLSINQRAELARTKTVHGDANPKWNETKYIIISNLNDALTLQVFDYNEIRKDKELGVASFPLDRLREDSDHENVSVPVLSNGKLRGQISCDVRFFPVLEGTTLEDGTKEPPPESNTGIVRFTVSQAKDLDHTKSLVGLLTPYAVMMLNGKPVFTSKVVKRNNNPMWSESHEMLITNRKACKLGVVVKDERDFQDDPVLGKYQISLNDMLANVEKGTEWYNLAGARTGRVHMKAEWKPVAIKGAIGGTSGYMTPIGVIRLHLQSAKDLRNLETMGKSDPYVRVLLNGVQKSRTVTFENDLNPEWDEVLYVPVHSAREKLSLEAMDQESMGKDRSLGAIELDLNEFVKEDEEGLYQVHAEKRNRSEGLILNHKGTPKGVLNFTAAFYPCLNVADPEEEEAEKELQDIQKGAQEASQKPESEKDAIDKQNDKPGTGEVDKQLAAQKSSLSPVFSEAGDADDKKPPKLRLTPEELLKYESGLLIFKIIEGEFARKDCYLEVLFDDNLFPSYSTSKIKSRSMKFDEIGDAVVRELEFSQIKLRLREHGDGDDEDEDKARLRGNTMETLKMCLNNPTVLTLKGKDSEFNKVKVSLKYIPLLMKLDPSESINNMGTLRVDILDAADLPAADRNGKSDPYCVFELDGKEVHKTKTLKKTLHPAWNEVFETKVASRTAADLTVDIFDWDFGNKADFLAKAKIDLTILDPFSPQIFHYKLVGKKGEEGKFGELRLRMVFKPDYVTRTRQGSSTFHGTFAVPGKLVTGVAGAPLKVGGAAIGGIGKGASFLKKSAFGRKSTSKDSNGNGNIEEADQEELLAPKARPGSSGSALRQSDGAIEEDSPTGPGKRLSNLSPAAAGGSPHSRSRSTSSQLSVPGVIGAGPDSGTATIRIVSASGFPPSANLQLRVRAVGKNKDVHKSKNVKSSTGEFDFDESFSLLCSADQQFQIAAKDDHLIRGDKPLGEGLFVVDDTGSGGETVVNVGEGKVTLKTSFQVAESGSVSPGKRRGILRRG